MADANTIVDVQSIYRYSIKPSSVWPERIIQLSCVSRQYIKFCLLILGIH